MIIIVKPGDTMWKIPQRINPNNSRLEVPVVLIF
jgi:hypothetical protein